MESHEKAFWWVWGEGSGVPTVKHQSRRAAEREAARLARKTGKRMYVLLATNVVEVEQPEPPVKWSDLRFCQATEPEEGAIS